MANVGPNKSKAKLNGMMDLVHKSKGALVAPREVLDRIQTLAPEALQTLEDLMRNAKAESVRFKAALEILGLAGVTKETRLSISTEVKDLDEGELDNRLVSLLAKAGQVVIEGESKEVKH